MTQSPECSVQKGRHHPKQKTCGQGSEEGTLFGEMLRWVQRGMFARTGKWLEAALALTFFQDVDSFFS